MKNRSLLASVTWLVVVAGGLLGGCDDSFVEDCVELCEKAQACQRVTFNIGTCDEQCSRFDDLADEAGCEDQFSEFVECAVDAPDVCHLEQSCLSETMSYYVCAEPYCEANPSAAECRGFECSYTGGGSGETCHVSAHCTGGSEFELDCQQGVCTCLQDGVDVGTVTFQEAFCADDFDTSIAAAQTACGWAL